MLKDTLFGQLNLFCSFDHFIEHANDIEIYTTFVISFYSSETVFIKERKNC